MKRLLYAAFLAFVAAGSVACAGTRYVAKDFTPMIPEMAKFETMSRIHLIEKGSRGEYNDSISWIARGELDSVLHLLGPKLPRHTEIEYASPFQSEFVGEEVDNLLVAITSNRANLRYLTVPPTIKSTLAAEGRRFGLIVVHDGFTRIKGNYGGQVAKSVGIGVLTGVLTMGMVSVAPVPIKENSTIHAIIVDTERDGVVFYNRSAAQADPTDPNVLTKQADNVFGKIFW